MKCQKLVMFSLLANIFVVTHSRILPEDESNMPAVPRKPTTTLPNRVPTEPLTSAETHGPIGSVREAPIGAVIKRLTRAVTYGTSSSSAQAVDCGGGPPTGLDGLLTEISNLLNNILGNIGSIRLAGLFGDERDVINLSNLMNEVRVLLRSLIGGSGLSSGETAEKEGLLTSLIDQITKDLDQLLGNGTGEKYACSGGIVGHEIDSIDQEVLDPLVNSLLAVVATILRLLI